MQACDHALHSNKLLIPRGFDIFDPTFISNTLHPKCINDQFAIGKYESMSHYCNFIRGAIPLINATKPIISECILYDYLQGHQIERIDLPYRLILSEVFSLAICGDSGAGKSHISQLINEILPFDSTLLLETDRYHKWERGAEEYKTWTHLHPEANNLEKMSSDAYSLSIGEDIYTVDYDHVTGKFTDTQKIKSNPFVIFCGLHTLYKDSMRDICDLRIYIDTDPDLKHYWKIKRDTTVRGATNSQAVLNTIERRQNDYNTFVAPQKEVADIIIRFKPRVQYIYDDLILEIELSTAFVHIFPIIDSLCNSRTNTRFVFTDPSIDIRPDANNKFKTCIPCIQNLKSGYAGIIQYIILLLLWKN
jgi:uridine kinase